MPKGKLTFNLPEEDNEFKDAVRASSLSAAVFSFKEWIHQREKHEDDAVKHKVYEEVKQYFNDTLWDYLADDSVF